MKALVHEGYDTTSALRFGDLDKPTPKSNEVLVKVYTTAINDWEFGVLKAPRFARLLLGWSRPKGKFNVMGCDVAGKVEAVGDDVQAFKVGDRVYGDMSGYRFGGFAEFLCVSEQHLSPMPASMGFEQAAAIPHAGELAFQALQRVPTLAAGQSVLVNGAGGGVGTLIIQMLKGRGIETTGVDRAEKLSMLRSLGYDHVIEYPAEDFTCLEHQYDVIIDTRTSFTPNRYLPVLKPRGVYITVGGEKIFRFMALLPWVNLFTSKQLKILALKPNKNLLELSQMFEQGRLSPVIDSIVRFDDIKNAYDRFERAEHQGKIVVLISSDS